MIVQGEKYACEACVRGHRVSSCQHADRPLTLIQKKGRPTSQCQHCRSLRKSRATHSRCDCAADRGPAKSDCAITGELAAEGNQVHHCCCSHGGTRCTCALKKDQHLDPVPEGGVAHPPSLADLKKPRLANTHSDSSIMTIHNGHHKPPHKHNDMASKCGLPYKIPRPHTIHGPSPGAPRSADNLLLNKRASKTLDMAAQNHHTFQPPPAFRRAKSEHGSPVLGPDTKLEKIDTSFPPLGNNFVNYETISPTAFPLGFSETSMLDAFFKNPTIPDYEQPPSAVPPLSAASVDWSKYDLPSGPTFSNVPSQPPSFTSYDYMTSHVAASSSGDPSEFGDLNHFSSMTASHQSPNGWRSPDDPTEANSYRLSSASSAHADFFRDQKQVSTDIDEYLRRVAAGEDVTADNDMSTRDAAYSEALDALTGATPMSQSQVQMNQGTALQMPTMQPPADFALHGFTLHQAQQLAHPIGEEPGVENLAVNQNVNAPIKTADEWDAKLPVTTSGNDPMWTDNPYDAQDAKLLNSDADGTMYNDWTS